jgi:Spy/CpxP family protein refolding chaperone
MKRHVLITATAATVLLGPVAAFAHRPGGHGCGGPMHACGRMLMHAHPDMLQSKLELSADQLARIEAIRTPFQRKKGDLRAQLAKERVKGEQLWQADLPAVRAVLAHMRKMRQLRGTMKDEKVKALLAMLKILSADQRRTLRSQCEAFGGGPGKGFWPGAKGGGCPRCGMGKGPGGPSGVCPRCGMGKGPGKGPGKR